MDRIEAMKIFIRVAELQSFTKAAESLDLPRANVSIYIRDLESYVNAKLLNRTTRHVELTPEGISLYERCKNVLLDIDEIQSMFSDNEDIKGKIRIDMSTRMATSIITPVLPDFLKKYPNIEFELSSTDYKIDLIKEGIDCVIRTICVTEPEKFFEPGLVEKSLGNIKIINCVSRKYIDIYGIPQNLNDLKNHKLIYYTNVLGSKPTGFEYINDGKYNDLKISGNISVTNTDTYLSACLAGLGIAQIPAVAIKEFFDRGELVEILPELKAPPLEIRLIYPYRQKPLKRVRIFLEWLEPVIKEIFN